MNDYASDRLNWEINSGWPMWSAWPSWASVAFKGRVFSPFRSWGIRSGTVLEPFVLNFIVRLGVRQGWLTRWNALFSFSTLSSSLASLGILGWVCAVCYLYLFLPDCWLSYCCWVCCCYFLASREHTVPNVCPSHWCNLCDSCIKFLWRFLSNRYKSKPQVDIFPEHDYHTVSS